MIDPNEPLIGIRIRAAAGQLRVTQHAQQEMVAENITLDDMLHALSAATLLENYPTHRRGACGLLYGRGPDGRDLHIVCTTADPMLVIITVYEPRRPKWVSPTQRSPSP